MPRMDGMELLQRLRQKTNMPVIFLTSKDDEIDEILGLRMGADDYVKKPFSQRLLVERIRTLLRRKDVQNGIECSETEETKVLVRGELIMDPLRHSVSWKGQDVTLTVTEFLMCKALAQRPGFVKSRDQLMDVAYDDQVYVMTARSTAISNGCVRKCVWLMIALQRLKRFTVLGTVTTKNK